jgi:zinc protease
VLAGTGTAAAKVFAPSYFRLDNGLEVVVIENHRVPAVIQMLWYKVGAVDEQAGHSGVAHLFEHLMFKATENTPANEFSAFVRRHGGRENAFTSWDYTGYYQVAQRDQLGQLMAYEADRMTALILSDEQIESERAVVLEEWNERIGQSPSAQLSQAMSSAMFQNTNYGRPVIGWRHEIEALDKDTIQAFYKRYYAPDNAVLVVAGDVEPEEVRALAEQHYGSIPPSNNPPAPLTEEPPPNAERRVILRDQRVIDPSWRRAYLAPSYNTAGSEHVQALEVLAELLGDRSVGRLAKELVRGTEQASAVGAYYSGESRGPTTFFLYASPRPNMSLSELEKAVEGQIERLLRDGVTVAEVSGTIKRMLASAVYARDDLETGARVLGEALATGGSIDQVESWPERLQKVTAADVMAAARLVLQPKRSVTGELLPGEPQS